MKFFRRVLAVALCLGLVHLPVSSSAAALADLTTRAPLTAPIGAPAFAAPSAAFSVVAAPAISLTAAPSLAAPSFAPALAPAAIPAPALAAVPAASVAVEPQAAPSARAALTPMSGAAAKGADLAPFYEGGRAAASVGDGVEAGAPALRPSGLAAASVRDGGPSNFAPSPNRGERGSAHTVLIVLIGVVAAIAIAVGVIWHHGQKQNDLWQNSKSNQDIVSVEKARRAGDDATLFAIAKDARVRQKDMVEKVADAQSRGVKKVDDATGDDLKTARAYASFDGLAGMRAEENANAVSKDASKRVGGELPATWRDRVVALDAAAKASGDEGALALSLRALRAEIVRDQAASSRFAGDIKDFDEHVPGMFGGRLKEMEKRAQADLDEFNSSELGAKQALYDQYDGAMRARVSAKLAAQSPEFQGHLAHMDRLNDAAQSLQPALELARQVDKDLQDMISHEHSREADLFLASQNEHVKVDDTDDKGNVIGYHYEDHSTTYKALAASEGAEARASAASAQAGIKALHTMLPLLRKDKTLNDEGLAFALPAQNNASVSQNGSVFFDFWIPASWNLFGSLFTESQASQARGAFSPVLNGLEQVSQEVANRKAGEAAWTNKAIDKDLDRQAAAAQQKP